MVMIMSKITNICLWIVAFTILLSFCNVLSDVNSDLSGGNGGGAIASTNALCSKRSANYTTTCGPIRCFLTCTIVEKAVFGSCRFPSFTNLTLSSLRCYCTFNC